MLFYVVLQRGKQMITFFTILLILIGANAIFMIFSLSGASNDKKIDAADDESDASTIYPLQTTSSKFEKAV